MSAINRMMSKNKLSNELHIDDHNTKSWHFILASNVTHHHVFFEPHTLRMYYGQLVIAIGLYLGLYLAYMIIFATMTFFMATAITYVAVSLQAPVMFAYLTIIAGLYIVVGDIFSKILKRWK